MPLLVLHRFRLAFSTRSRHILDAFVSSLTHTHPFPFLLAFPVEFSIILHFIRSPGVPPLFFPCLVFNCKLQFDSPCSDSVAMEGKSRTLEAITARLTGHVENKLGACKKCGHGKSSLKHHHPEHVLCLLFLVELANLGGMRLPLAMKRREPLFSVSFGRRQCPAPGASLFHL